MGERRMEQGRWYACCKVVVGNSITLYRRQEMRNSRLIKISVCMVLICCKANIAQVADRERRDISVKALDTLNNVFKDMVEIKLPDDIKRAVKCIIVYRGDGFTIKGVKDYNLGVISCKLESEWSGPAMLVLQGM